MKKSKKFLSLALAGALVLGLTACQQSDPTEEQAQAYTQQVAGLDADTVLFTVNGQDVTAEFYLYWLANDCQYWDTMSYYYNGAGLDFAADAMEGMTNAEYLKNDAQSIAASYILLYQEAQAKDAGLTEEQQAEWDQAKADYITQNGQDAYDLLLRQSGVSETVFEQIGTSNYLYQNLIDALPAEEAAQYAEDNNLFKAKHILLCTAQENEDGTVTLSTGASITNPDGTAYTGTAEEYNAQVKAQAEDLLAQIEASDDPVATFDELMNQYSEDTGLSSYPDGYTFTPEDSFVDEFKDAVYALDYNEYSGLVESDYGYHIILRTDLSSECMADQVNQWIENMEVVTTEAYDALDAGTFYTNYLTYQESLLAEADASAAPTDSAAPADSAEPADSASPEPTSTAGT